MNTKKKCEVTASAADDLLESGWDEGAWAAVTPLTLDHHMGTPPLHRPEVGVKLLYGHEHLYVHFRVNDRYVIATAENHQDSVCIDSCVEFFFTPSEDAGTGYFNIEVNCGGTVLFHHQQNRAEGRRILDVRAIRDMSVRHSLPRMIVPEIEKPTVWTLAYRVGYTDLEASAPVARPKPGAVWMGNFYKCADRSSHPHWLTWSPVDRPNPDFHRKEYFGTIAFR